MKTASELALEFWAIAPKDRINDTVQDYVYRYHIDVLSQIKGLLSRGDVYSNHQAYLLIKKHIGV